MNQMRKSKRNIVENEEKYLPPNELEPLNAYCGVLLMQLVDFKTETAIPVIILRSIIVYLYRVHSGLVLR